MNDLYLMCVIAGQRVALPALRVQSVIEVSDITPIPGTPAFVAGLTALRSQALTVIDCARAIGVAPGASVGERRAAVLEIEGYLYALMLDEAKDVGEARSTVMAVPGGFGAAWQRVALGLIETDGEPALLIDVETLLAGPHEAAA